MGSRDRGSIRGRALRALTPWLRHLDVSVSRWSNSYARRRIRYINDADVVGIVDVGANAGQYGAQLRTDGYRSRILSIEPLDEAFADLARLSAHDPRWDCVKCCLGKQTERPP